MAVATMIMKLDSVLICSTVFFGAALMRIHTVESAVDVPDCSSSKASMYAATTTVQRAILSSLFFSL